MCILLIFIKLRPTSLAGRLTSQFGPDQAPAFNPTLIFIGPGGYHRSSGGVIVAREYVEKREGGYSICGSRVSLESIVIPFLDGASPETLVDEFPTLSLEQVYGAVTFYLAHRAEIDAYVKETERLWREARESPPRIPAALRERLERARRELASA